MYVPSHYPRIEICSNNKLWFAEGFPIQSNGGCIIRGQNKLTKKIIIKKKKTDRQTDRPGSGATVRILKTTLRQFGRVLWRWHSDTSAHQFLVICFPTGRSVEDAAIYRPVRPDLPIVGLHNILHHLDFASIWYATGGRSYITLFKIYNHIFSIFYTASTAPRIIVWSGAGWVQPCASMFLKSLISLDNYFKIHKNPMFYTNTLYNPLLRSDNTIFHIYKY